MLIGNCDEIFNEYLSEYFSWIIQRKLGSEFALRIMSMSTPRCQELLKLAEDHVFDIFFLFLNNICFPSDNYAADKSLEKSLQLVTHLRTTYRKPVIALYGWPRDPSLVAKAKLAGASFAFQAPTKSKELEEAIERCLDMLIPSQN